MNEHTHTRFIEANGQAFETLVAGSGERVALCLHGFPEHACSWRYQMQHLANQGFEVWAPNLRGYGRSSRPPRMRDYSVELLMQDVAGLIDAAGGRPVTLLAHDWGAVIAWYFAMRRLRPLERLVIINVPHPAVMAREIRDSGRQRRKSWYVLFFQLPFIPELLMIASKRSVISPPLMGLDFGTRLALIISTATFCFHQRDTTMPNHQHTSPTPAIPQPATTLSNQLRPLPYRPLRRRSWHSRSKQPLPQPGRHR